MSLKQIVVLALSIGVMSACSEGAMHNHTYIPDQEARIKLFDSCLQRIPEGPEHTKYNDWAEVVTKCDRVSYHQSKVRTCVHSFDDNSPAARLNKVSPFEGGVRGMTDSTRQHLNTSTR